MKRTKRILALAGAVFLAGLYIMTLVFAIIKSDLAQSLFRASFACTFLIPVLLYAYMLFYRINHKEEDKKDSRTKQDEK